MMSFVIEEILKNKQDIVNKKLDTLFISDCTEHERLFDAMRYSLLAGGKRIRPILFLLILDIFNKNSEKYLDVACALECVHTYSLIHDDLPGMDNDDYRRGKLTNHKKYGTGIAILAGDGLLTYAFELISESLTISADIKIHLIRILSKASGACGMLGGQAHDKMVENKEITLDELRLLDQCKTGCLISAPIEMACEIAQVDSQIKNVYYEWAVHLGLLFQITDDLLDQNGHLNDMGKNPLQDVINHKSTYVTLLGEEKARLMAEREATAAISLCKKMKNAGALEELIGYILHRNK